MSKTKQDMEDIMRKISDFTNEVGLSENSDEAKEVADALLELMKEVGYVIDSIGDDLLDDEENE
jgi:hypothetical protein